MTREEEFKAVMQLGETIGYGNMMDIASALWGLKLLKKYGSSEGAFVSAMLTDIKRIPRSKIRMNQFLTMEQIVLEIGGLVD